ncbi:L,D-transpeptidase family protein [Sphingomonas arenae]|uniref:L,D-transpeptidase family protein n=1 Tax=Sphingomonas arenae TaxID=2812555 RepID=UPI001EFF8399|nr:L,D-transpeptidase family protein [Sphingomonas arenae]
MGPGVAAGLALALAPLPVAAAAPLEGAVLARPAYGQSVEDFYAARGWQPLWLRQSNGDAATELLMLLRTARSDGLNPKRYRTREIERALRAAWGGNPHAVRRAELELSSAYVAYARDLRDAPDVGTIYVDPELRPKAPSPRALLELAAASPSLPRFVAGMGWMHPYYAELRNALIQGNFGERSQPQLLQLNLERARSLPGGLGRYVVVNIAQQRLFMMENGQVVDSMRVVVGKPVQPTPMMAALIRFTSLNPYWNVPPDLAAERVAPFVLKEGLGFLRSRGYQVLSDWSDNPKVVNPSTVDWRAVAEGRTEIRVRQLPGPSNSMGAMKFMFPNAQGIYLHDTPSTELFNEASRMFSGGCVRLEAAPRLATWLYGKPLRAKGAKPEQAVPLPQPVPVYLTYLTAVPSGSEVAFYQDIYGRDAQRLAQRRGGREVAAR